MDTQKLNRLVLEMQADLPAWMLNLKDEGKQVTLSNSVGG